MSTATGIAARLSSRGPDEGARCCRSFPNCPGPGEEQQRLAQVVQAIDSQPLHIVLQGGALESKPGRRACRARQRAPGLAENFDDVFAFFVAQRTLGLGRLSGDLSAQLVDSRPKA